MNFTEKYKKELENAYIEPLDAAELESKGQWISRVADGTYSDADVMSFVALRDKLRADLASLTAELCRMREALTEIQELSFQSFLSKNPLADYMAKVNHIAKAALQESPDD